MLRRSSPVPDGTAAAAEVHYGFNHSLLVRPAMSRVATLSRMETQKQLRKWTGLACNLSRSLIVFSVVYIIIIIIAH